MDFNGLVLAAGRGSRLQNRTSVIAKCLLPITSEYRLIDYSMEKLLKLNPKRVVVVVNYKADQVIEYIRGKAYDLPVDFLFQNNLNGIVGALSLYSKLYQESVILALSDEFFDLPHQALISRLNSFKDSESFAHLFGNVLDSHPSKANEISKTYSIVESVDGWVSSIKEKPSSPMGNLQGIGFSFFSNRCFPFLDQVAENPHTRQRDLDLLVNKVISAGAGVQVHKDRFLYFNINSEVEYRALQDLFSDSNKFRL